MDLISCRELHKNTAKYADQKITLGGWIKNLRASKNFGFLVLNADTNQKCGSLITDVMLPVEVVAKVNTITFRSERKAL